MKKTFILLFLLATGAGITRAQETSRCNYATSIEAIVKKTDSMGLFFRRLQTGYADQWPDIVKAAKSEKGLAALELCGTDKESLTQAYNQLHEGIGKELRQLIRQVDPDNQLPDDKFSAIVEDAFQCYIKDRGAIDLREVAGTAGRFAAGDIGGQLGPCDQALQGCVSDARDVRLQSLNACGLTGTGFLIALKKLLNWISGGAAFVCYMSASLVYNSSIDGCLDAYIECLGRQGH